MKKVIILLFSVSLFLSNDAVADEESEIKYLTKRDGNRIYHFRVIINGKNLDVIDGQFYNSISKWGKNCVTNENANSEALQLINNKLKDGYIETEFKESKENTYEIYDKAKYHFNGRFFPKNLDENQAFVHTGMYVGWLAENDMFNKEWSKSLKAEIKKFKKRKLKGSDLYKSFDGAISINELNELGNKFSLEYFDFDTGHYLIDYDSILVKKLPTMYHVKDTWENYFKMKRVIDKRFKEWKEKNLKEN